MIYRELREITVNIYVNELDKYGQKRQKGSSTRTIEGVVKTMNQFNIENPKYVDIELIVLTKDCGLSNANTLTIDGKEYQIKYITNTSRYNMVFCSWLK